MLLDLECISGSESMDKANSSELLDEDLLGLNMESKPNKSESKDDTTPTKQGNNLFDWIYYVIFWVF